ncbi:hypothetical protein GXW83_22100 [Streptacidiphilus sp. PB12-B1b]|uniref:hypothetical protein n=1 Tax=Streptacidiphilus sp. PB12-B1b TaxID=2705012 RepID=UPI0015FD400A|nr:hypothetical protein [Streptacidiphilus sp. PB12-B1b]QMU77986.1 hypothetical protein GXW83_22100 [Streptacidiphilus sp. PB12-B1b]
MAPAVIAAAAVARSLGKRSPSSTAARGPRPVPIDPGHGDPELVALRTAVAGADWPAVEAVLKPCRERADHARLTWLISGVEDIGGDFLLNLPERLPDNPLALSVAGARHVAWAWEARTGARAARVTQEQFHTFHERLRTAEEHLYAAVELDPESASPWCFLTTASRGLEHGHAVTRRRFDAGVRRAPHHTALHAAMLQQLCAKWGGSHEQMHGFARQAVEQAPPGSTLGVLTAYAHIEHWFELPKAERPGYLRGGSVVAELKQAAAVSVLHPAYAPTESPYGALNAFAMVFWLAGERALARDLFQRIGDHPTRFPWAYVGSPGQVFATARQECKKRK